MIDTVYFRQAELLLRVLPLVDREAVFALKGGTAINFFVRDLPLLPEEADELQDLALEVIQKSAALGNRQHPMTLNTLRELLRIINSYYSNLIEGHNTHPHDIVRAMQKEYDSEPAKRNLQLESVAHITVQRDMDTIRHGEDVIRKAGNY